MKLQGSPLSSLTLVQNFSWLLFFFEILSFSWLFHAHFLFFLGCLHKKTACVFSANIQHVFFSKQVPVSAMVCQLDTLCLVLQIWKTRMTKNCKVFFFYFVCWSSQKILYSFFNFPPTFLVKDRLFRFPRRFHFAQQQISRFSTPSRKGTLDVCVCVARMFLFFCRYACLCREGGERSINLTSNAIVSAGENCTWGGGPTPNCAAPTPPLPVMSLQSVHE